MVTAMNAPLTVFPDGATETEKTDKTDCVGNAVFLEMVFGSELQDSKPILVNFAGNPGKVAKSAWYGQAWQPGKSVFSAEKNNYFSLASFFANESGEYRRLKANFQALYAVMLDDIGSKVDLERLTLAPSWLLETSLGNYQAGYLLSEPLTDGLLADRLVNAIVAANLCDPGANGPRARLARLPVAVNGKHNPPFKCRMVDWSPDLRYSVADLVAGLQLEMVEGQRPKRQVSRQPKDRPIDGDPVWLPRPDENPVLTALRDRGLLKAPLGAGKHDVTCPWVHEHTGEVDNGTAYFEPDDNWAIGGFKCLHGHCAGRNIRTLLDFLDLNVNSVRMKPTIRVVSGDIHRVVDAAELELANAGRFYQQGGLIVTVTTDPGTFETRVQDVRQPALVRALAGVASWEKYDARAEDWVRTDPPARHAGVLYDSIEYRHLPVIKGLARQPYLRSDGSLMTQAGYDVATGMFGVFDTRKFSVADKPSRADAEAALSLLKELVAEFSFAGNTDLAAALSAILTAVVRPSLPHAPMFHVRAHMVGSGKSYLCELFTAFATPRRGTPSSFPADDEECRKMLLAELLCSPAVIEFDNLTSDLLAHKSLCTVLTSEHFSGRILGISKMATVNTRTLFLSSGNNVGPIQDMSRRCITINLSPQCETPATRNFKRPDLIREVLQERSRYVSAALTIVRAWLVAGQPKTEVKSLASFGEWSALCRQPLLWLGCADPAISVFEAMAEDPERETLTRLLKSWFTIFGNKPTMVRDAVRQATLGMDDHIELKELLHDIADERGEINRRRLGWWIKRNAGRIVEGMRFVRASGNRSADAWIVESVLSVSTVLNPANEKSVNHTEFTPNAYARASRGE